MRRYYAGAPDESQNDVICAPRRDEVRSGRTSTRCRCRGRRADRTRLERVPAVAERGPRRYSRGRAQAHPGARRPFGRITQYAAAGHRWAGWWPAGASSRSGRTSCSSGVVTSHRRDPASGIQRYRIEVDAVLPAPSLSGSTLVAAAFEQETRLRFLAAMVSGHRRPRRGTSATRRTLPLRSSRARSARRTTRRSARGLPEPNDARDRQQHGERAHQQAGARVGQRQASTPSNLMVRPAATRPTRVLCAPRRRREAVRGGRVRM